MSQGYTASGDPRAWSIVNGKLYVNYSASVRTKWEKNREAYIAQAEANWPAVLKKYDAARDRTHASAGVTFRGFTINYLRRTLPIRSVRFRMTAPMQPVVVVENGKAVAVLMPVAQ